MTLSTSAWAQTQGEPVFVEVLNSPIPAPRSMPPEIAPPLEEDPNQAAALTLPQGEVAPETPATSGEIGVSVLRPGTDGPVRVVFGEDPQAPEQPPLTSIEAPDQVRWQEERARQFRRAPRTHGGGEPVGGPIAPIDPVDTVLQGGATLRQLDKMTGQVRTVSVPVNEETRVARLLIQVSACRAPEDGAQHGTMAFLKVRDSKAPDVEVFSGWMFAESPALSAMDHPRYDLWVISCTTSSGETSAASE